MSTGLRIAIIGAGIGGLSLSAALGFMSQRDDLQIDIYENAPCISDIGAGISIWPRTWVVAKAMGLQERLLSFLPAPPNDSPSCIMRVRKSDQAQGFHVRDILQNGGAMRFHRADLQHVLKESMYGQLHLSHTLTSYEDKGDEVLLKFANGTIATCDFLIGFDGINSVVRKGLVHNRGGIDLPSLNPVWSGSIAYRALIQMDKLKEVSPDHNALSVPMLYSGKSKHIVTYPISQDRILNIVAYDTDVSKIGTTYNGATALPSTPAELLSVYREWEEEVQTILQCVSSVTKWIVRDLVPLNHYSFGRVAIAGDAAHAMTPHQGAGAGQAIEVGNRFLLFLMTINQIAIKDAFILASLIADPKCTRNNIHQVSEIYDIVSCPRGNRAMTLSRLTGELCDLIAPGLEDSHDDILETAFQRYEEGLRWTREDIPYENQEQALNMLHSLA
uniref:FAD-binding domain-containing protein n=1 Tax=Psilocybe cubensis TaxID=181762 RepID=A0A8H8CFB4_PSICU